MKNELDEALMIYCSKDGEKNQLYRNTWEMLVSFNSLFRAFNILETHSYCPSVHMLTDS